GTRPEFEAAAAWMATLPQPQLHTPGNHDTPEFDLVTRITEPWARFRRFFGESEFATFAKPRLTAAAFNTARGIQARMNWSKGSARVSDVELVIGVLGSGAPGDLRVAVCHHPLMEVTGGPMTGAVRNGARAAEMLAEGGADLILTGHVHTPFAHALPFGDARTFAVGGATLSLRERGAPAGYNSIEADEAEIRVTAMGWTGSHFEAQRSWGFTRRQPQGSGGASRAA
ncbi:MAG: metallophosphoesterase family protein, partial [Caulobacteraceae bacterium]